MTSGSSKLFEENPFEGLTSCGAETSMHCGEAKIQNFR